MYTANEKSITIFFKKVSLWISFLIFVIATIVIIEWASSNLFFYSLIEGKSVPMNPFTALLFLLSMICFWIKFNKSKWEIFANVLCLIMFLFCSLKLISLFFHLNINPDLILFKNRIASYKNIEMAANTSINFVFTFFALYFIDYETKSGMRPAQYLCYLIIFISLIATYGFIYDIRYLYTLFTDNPMAISTTISFYLMAMAILLSRPDKGNMRIFVGQYSSLNLILRIIAIILPLFLGWLKLKGEELHLYSKETGTAIFALLTYFLALFLIGFNTVYQQKIRRIIRVGMNKLKEKEERLKIVTDNITEAVIVADIKSNPVFVNKNALDLIGNIKEGVSQENWPETYGIFSMEGKPIHTNDLAISRALRGLSTDNFEYLFKNQKSPEGRYISSSGRPIKDIEGNVVEGITVFRDITQRKKLEKIYFERSQRLKAVLMSIEEGVLVTDREGNFVLINSRAKELMGVESGLTKITDWSKFFKFYYPDKFTIFPQHKLPLFRALKGEKSDEVEVYVRNEITKEGKLIRTTGTPIINENGNFEGGVVIFRDI